MPVTEAFGKNFKGQTFTQPLGKLNLFTGENGSGKSTISDALVNTRFPIARNQQQPFFNAYGGTDPLVSIGFKTDKQSYEKVFKRSRKGAVSQKFTVDDSANQDPKDFENYIAIAPRIFNLQGFLSLSDQKKIDMIFSLFPHKEDVEDLATQLESKKKTLNKNSADLSEHEAVIERLTRSKAAIQLPSGNLASVKFEIDKIKKQLDQARKDLKDAETERIQEEARLKCPQCGGQKKNPALAVCEECEKINADKAEQSAFDFEKDNSHSQAASNQVEKQEKHAAEFGTPYMIDPQEEARKNAEAGLRAKNTRMGIVPSITAESSINRIMGALQSAGCGTCAALLVCKAELKKHKSETPEMRF